MFDMKIEQQMNMKDRTLILGKPNYDTIPNVIKVEEKELKVIGVSSGVKFPYLSLEIEKTELQLTGKRIIV